jgi:hypothetical protein
MAISKHLTYFAGLPIVEFDPKKGVTDPTGRAYRVAGDSWRGNPIGPRLEAFLKDERSAQVKALVIGAWGESGDGPDAVVDALIEAADRLTSLRSVFLGDIIYEELEISWIAQSDPAPLLAAFPDLEDLWLRGTEDLEFSPVEHDRLRTLAVQTGGLPAEVVRGVLQSKLPALEHLELWLGEDNYGGTVGLDDLRRLFEDCPFPNLVSLALRDAPIADQIAAALVESPLVRRLHVLDLSLGTLGDEGAQALLRLRALAPNLERLDVHHHYISDGVLAQLRQLRVAINAEGRQQGDEDERYVAVSE